MNEDIKLFKQICLDLHAASSGVSYDTVVLKVLQTKYRLLLPEEMETSEIAYVLNVSYKQINNILLVLLGARPNHPKSRLNRLAYYIKLKDSLPDGPILPSDIEHEMVDRHD